MGIDYTRGENIASDVITHSIRVSTACFPNDCGDKDRLIETWIFDNRPLHSKQYIHKRGRERAIKFHNYIVKKLNASETVRGK